MQEIIMKLIDNYPDLKTCAKDIESARGRLCRCFERNGVLLICGNGGSAADASHIAGEMVKGFTLERRPLWTQRQRLSCYLSEEKAKKLQRGLPAIALSDHCSLMTAIANDNDPSLVFAQQVFVYGAALGGTLLAISTSGDSPSVVDAALTAAAVGMDTVAITGRRGGRLKECCDVCIRLPCEETARVQELTLPVYHALCAMVEERFFAC